MEILTESNLTDCLNLLSVVNFRKIEVNDRLIEMYFKQLSYVDRYAFDRSIDHFYNQRIFPTPQELLEFLGEVEPIDRDWYKIAGVARQSIKSETISGVSLTALVKVTSANGMRSALLAISRADDNQVNRYRIDWQKECKRVDKSGLPPSSEAITLEIPASQKDLDYPVDSDYSVRTASLIRLLESKEIKTSTAKGICARFPQVKKAEVMAVIEEIEGGEDVVIVGESSPRIRSMSVGIVELAGLFNPLPFSKGRGLKTPDF